MRLVVCVTAALLLVPVLAVEAAPATSPRIVDDAGDARDGKVRKAVSETCDEPVDLFCLSSVSVEEGDPAVDLLSATFTDTPRTLEIALEMGAVSEDHAGLFRDQTEDEAIGVEMDICWGSGDFEDITQCVAFIARSREGQLETYGVFVVLAYNNADCAASYCAWHVPHRLEPGAPGNIVFEVPRALLPNGTEGDTLHTGYMRVWKYAANQVYRPFRHDAFGKYGRLDSPGGGWMIDATYDEDFRFIFATPRTGGLDPWSPLEDAATWSGEGDRPDIDVLGVDLVDRGQALTFAMRMGRVDETPAPDQRGWINMGNLRDAAINAGFQVVDGVRVPWGGWCLRSECGTSDAAWHEREVTLDIVAGEPGWINLTLDKTAYDLRDGELLAYAIAEMWTFQQETPAEGVPFATATHAGADETPFLPPYVVGSNPGGTLGSGTSAPRPVGIEFADDAGDAVPPDEPTAATAFGPLSTGTGQFDLLGARAEATSDRETRITLSVQDLGNIKVPSGANSVFYAVGVQTAEGQFMVGFMKQGGNTPGSVATQKFFCAQDTAVFQPERSDPINVVLQDIKGQIALAGGNSTAGGGGTRGSIVFFVPNECFARDTPGKLVVQRMAAGSYLVATYDGQVKMLDETEGEHSGVLEAASVPTAPPLPFWKEPFGLPWDVWGIVAAAVTSAGGLLLVARRRSLLKRYLAEVERADERALVEIRARLKRDLVRGVISEGHFAIVERRLDERLSRSRVEGLKEAFHELPMRLLERLQAMLADGRMSADDHRVFMALLVDAPLTAEAKERVREKLQAWVAKDAA